MQTPRLRPKNLGKKKKSSNKPKLRPAGLGATKEEMDAMDRGFRIQKMEGREREDVKKKASGGKLKMVKNKKGEWSLIMLLMALVKWLTVVKLRK